jgi:hypothetical protein
VLVLTRRPLFALFSQPGVPQRSEHSRGLAAGAESVPDTQTGTSPPSQPVRGRRNPLAAPGDSDRYPRALADRGFDVRVPPHPLGAGEARRERALVIRMQQQTNQPDARHDLIEMHKALALLVPVFIVVTLSLGYSLKLSIITSAAAVTSLSAFAITFTFALAYGYIDIDAEQRGRRGPFR